MPYDQFLEHYPHTGLQREAHLRSDRAWLEEQRAGPAAVYIMWHGQNLFSISGEKRPLVLPAAALPSSSRLIFLGLRPDNQPVFAASLTEPKAASEALSVLGLEENQARFIHLREFRGLLTPDEQQLLLYVRALINWQDAQQFCSRCGSPTLPEEAGHVMTCTNPECATKHFPRSDPATIMLVQHGDRCLLGRQPSWPEGLFSTLAGFVEAGESVEEAVVREVKEEAGIEITNLRYFGSQPWPFPQSLMLGYFAEAVTTGIVRGSELAEVRWFDVAETKEVLRRHIARFPHIETISQKLMKHWLAL
ncbi:MAG TPA: NAD(+) diphosphatase [Chthoniobacterales bacterium]|nr:NAD(+) diphosphatase [Chthoniobacterales bacterium]